MGKPLINILNLFLNRDSLRTFRNEKEAIFELEKVKKKASTMLRLNMISEKQSKKNNFF
jgi:hypothetical protein